ncbi:hypothetical protein C8Q70DRAFT_1014686 [Cubamyces menziesii]|nr:hypothetical protein C8Q70DRAFT_1014686 [Cubamyces menziesii]
MACETLHDPSHLPGEIVDAIVDHLPDEDKATLRSCSLVCSGWLPSSRRRLFATFLSDAGDFALTDLIDFISSAPDVCCHIRRFILRGYSGISLKDLVVLLSALPDVRVVELQRLGISRPLPSDPVLRSLFPELSALKISMRCSTDKDIDTLFRVLGLFTIVHTLRLEHTMGVEIIHLDADGLPVVSPIVGVPVPETLQVSKLSTHGMPPPLLSRLIRPSRMTHWGTLKSLELEEFPAKWDQLADVGDLLAEVGPRLRSLAIRPPCHLPLERHFGLPFQIPGAAAPWHPGMAGLNPAGTVDDATSAWAQLNLSKCTSLQVFTIPFYLGVVSPLTNVNSLFKINIDILTHLPNTVRSIRLLMVIMFPPRVPPPDWAQQVPEPDAASGGPLQELNWPLLDETLSDDRFKSLKVILNMSSLNAGRSEQDYQMLLGFVQMALHRLRRRGRLSFEHTRQQPWWAGCER